MKVLELPKRLRVPDNFKLKAALCLSHPKQAFNNKEIKRLISDQYNYPDTLRPWIRPLHLIPDWLSSCKLNTSPYSTYFERQYNIYIYIYKKKEYAVVITFSIIFSLIGSAGNLSSVEVPAVSPVMLSPGRIDIVRNSRPSGERILPHGGGPYYSLGFHLLSGHFVF